MTAVATAGASSRGAVDWHDIDWQKVHRTTRRLQARIVKATQDGRWGKVKALQHLLTHSFSGKVLAVRRVTENRGKKTPGIDGEIWDTPDQKSAAVDALRQKGYRAQPLRRVHIPKSTGTTRPLGIATMRDRAMQTLYLLALDPIAETLADPNSYGFRIGRSTADALEQCFNTLSLKRSARWILEGDIASCFDEISQVWLLANIPTDSRMLRQWLKAGFFEQKRWYPTETGSPQGGPISPVLANRALDGLEAELRARWPSRTKAAYDAKMNLVRYCDDFIITGSSRELLEGEVLPIVEDFLATRGLRLSKEKTRITRIEDGFDFLGANVRKYNGKLLITPSKKNVKTFLSKIRGYIKANPHLSPQALMIQLNPKLRGWAQYHRAIVSTAAFRRVDTAVWETTWRWAKRRHLNKPAYWIKAKYYRRIGNRDWVFAQDYLGKDGQPHQNRLFLCESMKIRRHTKIQSEANPYDPRWETYFERRLDVEMEANLKGRRQLLRLWVEQDGICPICHEKITRITGWHSHHIIWRSKGGSDGNTNRILLHPNCHRQLHCQGLSVEKPRPNATGV